MTEELPPLYLPGKHRLKIMQDDNLSRRVWIDETEITGIALLDVEIKPMQVTVAHISIYLSDFLQIVTTSPQGEQD